MRTPVDSVDSSWLRMDDPTNLMVVTGVMVLDEPVAFEAVRDMLDTHLLTWPRFRQRIVEPTGGVGTPTWETDPHFALTNHLQEVELDPPGDEGALQTFVSGLMSQPLNPAQPLWRFYFIPHYQGGSALAARIHHCIGDGLALTHVILSMADGGPQAPPQPAEAAPEAGDGDHAGPWEAVARAIGSAAEAAVSVPAGLLRKVSALLGDSERLSQTAAGLGTLGRLLMLEADPRTRFKGKLVAEKKVAWSRAIPVADLKLLGRATGSTINDILMACLAGSLRRYLVGRGETPAPGLNVRGVVPVNLRPLEQAHELGNKFGLVFLSLPLGDDDPLDRLFEVRRRMAGLKSSPEAVVVYQLLKAFGVVPKAVFDLIVEYFGSKGTAVVTNVVGPREPISIAGVKMRQCMFWVPSAGRLGLGVSLLSYAGQVWLGIQSDAGLVPDPDRLLDGFYAEVDELASLKRAAES